jgi:integration host factor subunit beta
MTCPRRGVPYRVRDQSPLPPQGQAPGGDAGGSMHESPARRATQKISRSKTKPARKAAEQQHDDQIRAYWTPRHAKSHLYQRDLENAVNAILGEIVASLSRRDRVEIRGFGVFSVRNRPPRTGRNPRSGAAVVVTQKFMPFFRTGRQMHRRLNRPET